MDEQKLDNRDNSSASAATDVSPTPSESGFRGFNRVGREDTTTEVLRPQVDSALLMRRAIMIAIVAVLLAVVGYLAFSRSHLSFGGGNSAGPNFTPPTHD